MTLILMARISLFFILHNKYVRDIAWTLFSPQISKTYVPENYSIFGISDWKQLTISGPYVPETAKFPSSPVRIWKVLLCSFCLFFIDCQTVMKIKCHIISIAEEKPFHCSADVSSNECKYIDTGLLANRCCFVADSFIRFYVNVRADPLNSVN